MKRLFTLVCVLALSMPVFGQRAERRDADFSDLMTLLKAAGYELYSFDIEGIKYVELEIREYIGGKLVEEEKDIFGGWGDKIDRINIGLYPSDCDSVKLIQFCAPGAITLNMPLNLRKIDLPDGTTEIFYDTRPFKPSETKGFIPLVLLGSGWWDEQAEITRFCGDKELEPDLSNEIIKNIPHYYVIGVNVK